MASRTTPAPVWLSIDAFAKARAGLDPEAAQVRAVKAALLSAGFTAEQVASLRLRSLPEEAAS